MRIIYIVMMLAALLVSGCDRGQALIAFRDNNGQILRVTLDYDSIEEDSDNKDVISATFNPDMPTPMHRRFNCKLRLANIYGSMTDFIDVQPGTTDDHLLDAACKARKKWYEFK